MGTKKGTRHECLIRGWGGSRGQGRPGVNYACGAGAGAGAEPSVGRFSTTGVVPACYLLDCVSVFALSVQDGAEVALLMENTNVTGGFQGDQTPWV